MKIGFTRRDLALPGALRDSERFELADVMPAQASWPLADLDELATCPVAALADVIDAFLRSLELAPLGDLDDAQWHEVTGDVARRALMKGLRFGLAYGRPHRSAADARVLADAILHVFAAPARFFVNFDNHPHLDDEGAPPGPRGGYGAPITPATFELCVLALSRGEAIGLFVVTDED